MKKLNGQTTCQLLMILLGVGVGAYFSNKVNDTHGGLKADLLTHSNMHHGSIDISQDAVIPRIVNIELFKDTMAGWNLHINTKDFRFSPENAGSQHIPGEGHAHLMINGKKVARIYSKWFHVPALDYPIKELEITLNANSHQVMTVNGKAIARRLINRESE
ncbi:hypothetical protein QQ020_23540 [Fulvivirgaceae bacterium BMA12]|uniref:Uncharacterized protein n=1 Tax=Agaribacillus aureus TaxID=3051825 RepID=A0ABT8LE80_9BACT|nr:hypothetical protein [Fulvivirgaceae bacterium BMA12]